MLLVLTKMDVEAAESNDIVEAWNQTEYASDITKAYKKTTQCAAYAKYAFFYRYNHSCGLMDSNNTISEYIVTSGEELEQLIEEYAVVGDAIRVSLYENGIESEFRTHIFLLEAYDEGSITVSESNYGVKNLAREYTYIDGAELLSFCCGTDTGDFLAKAYKHLVSGGRRG